MLCDTGMLVVGAHLLQAFWDRHPEAEPRLRALHALLSRGSAGDVGLLAGAERDPDGALRVRLQGAEVRLRMTAGLAKIERVKEI